MSALPIQPDPPTQPSPSSALSQWFSGAGDKLHLLIESVAARAGELTAREVHLIAREAELAAAESRMRQHAQDLAALEAQLASQRADLNTQKATVEHQQQSNSRQQAELVQAAQDLRSLADELKRRELDLTQRTELVSLSESAIGQFQNAFNRAFDDWVTAAPSSLPNIDLLAGPKQDLAEASQRLHLMRRKFGLESESPTGARGDYE